MRFSVSFIVIPLITISLLYLGRVLTKMSESWAWYQSINLPQITPPSWVFPVVWNLIFIATTIAAIIVWNRFERTTIFWWIIALFLINGILNILWTIFFFRHHLIGVALLDAVALEIVNILLFVFIARESLGVAALLVPYLVWVGFAIYLNYLILTMN